LRPVEKDQMGRGGTGKKPDWDSEAPARNGKKGGRILALGKQVEMGRTA